MNRSGLARFTCLAVVGLGASSLTLVILLAPDLSVATLTGLVGARIALGLMRWSLAFQWIARRVADMARGPRFSAAT